MTVRVFKPPAERPVPFDDSGSTGQVLMLSVAGKAKAVVFKVKYDPAKHPKDWKGRFIETPDKIKATEAAEGDTLVTKSGKLFKVEKQTAKGVKVNPVDPDGGEVADGYTVLGNDIEVAVVETGKAVGSIHPIGDLEPGTFVQHPKSKKRFIVSKHGKWTTIYPVDDHGNTSGKHTVLPKGTKVEIVPKSVTEHPTPHAISTVKAVAATVNQPTPLTADEVFEYDLAFASFKAALVHDVGYLTGMEPENATVTVEAAFHPLGAPADWKPTADEIYANALVILNEDSFPAPPDLKSKIQASWDDQMAAVALEFAKVESDGSVPLNETQILADPALRTQMYERAVAIMVEGEDAADLYPVYLTDALDVQPKNKEEWSSFVWSFHSPLAWSDEQVAPKLAAWEKAIEEIGQANAVSPDSPSIDTAQVLRDAVENWIAQSDFADTDVEPPGKSLMEDISDFVKEPTVEGWLDAWKLRMSVDMADPEEAGDVASLKDALTSALAKAEIAAKQGPGLTQQDMDEAAFQAIMTKLDDSVFMEDLLMVFDPGDRISLRAHVEAVHPGTAAAAWKAIDGWYQARHGYGLDHNNYSGESYEDAVNHEMVAAVAVAQAELQAQHAPKSTPQQVQEILPSKLPKVPKKYEAGVGKDTRIVIEHATNQLARGYGDTGAFVVRRVGPGYPDDDGVVLGAAGKITHARAIARSRGAAHEQIEERSAHRQSVEHKWEKGQYAINGSGKVFLVDEIVEHEYTHWDGSQKVQQQLQVKDIDENISVHGTGILVPVSSEMASANDLDPLTHKQRRQALREAGMLGISEAKVFRKGRPEKYISELQSDWAYDELADREFKEAHKRLTKLGWREVKPRQKGMVRYVNARNQRLTVYKNGQMVDKVEEASMYGSVNTGSAKELHATLSEAIAQGASVDDLDPRNAGDPAARTSHAQQMVYDMAVGKINGIGAVLGKGAKVKSDDAYRTEIEKDSVVGPIEAYLAQAEIPDLRVKARGGVVDKFGLQDDPRWDFPNRELTVPEGFTPMQTAALSAIVSHQGVADHFLGESHSDVTPTFDADWTQIKDPFEAAKALATAWEADALTSRGMDEGSRQYIGSQLLKHVDVADQRITAREQEHLNRAQNMREQAMHDEIDARRKVEGTVKESSAEFDLPTWDEIEMEAQTYEEIDLLAANVPVGAAVDVPAFYSGGMIRDGLLYHRADETWAGVMAEHDDIVLARLTEAGAERKANPNPIDPGYSGSADMYPGEALVLEEDTTTPQALLNEENQLSDETRVRIRRAIAEVLPGLDASQAKVFELAVTAMAGTTNELTEEGAEDGMRTYLKSYWGSLPNAESRVERFISISRGVVTRRIEYVPHDQAPGDAGGAPTSQRGRLTLYGYSPEYAAQRLQMLGLLGKLEEEVPFKQILRSTRRYGAVAPILPAYVRGEADLPKTPARITHGLTGGTSMDALEAIMASGGLLSIQERYRHGILKDQHTTSSAGDIRSGIDHAVFCTLGFGGACGGGSPVKIVVKPSGFLRRDIVLAPTDFGGAATRYPAYRNYLNGLQGDIGEDKTNLYEPVSPAARQFHLDKMGGGMVHSSNEYNLGPSIPIEDWEHVLVPPDSVDKVNEILDTMLSEGRIASKPKVHTNTDPDANKLGNVETAGTKVT